MIDASGIKPGSWEAWKISFRPKTLGIALAPVFVGISAAFSVTGHLDVLIAFITAIVAAGVQALSNMENDVGYTKRKAERSNRKGLPRATSLGLLTCEQVDRAILITGLLILLLSCMLVFIGGWGIVVLGAASIAAAYLYMGGPKPIAYTPYGELTVFIFFGIIAVNGTYYLQTGGISLISIAFGAACGAIASGVLAVNNRRDMAHDASVGRNTLAVVLGKRRMTRLYLYMLLSPFAIVLLTVTLEPRHFFYLISFAPILNVKPLYQDFKQKEGVDLNNTLFGTVQLEVKFAFSLTAGALLDAAWCWYL